MPLPPSPVFIVLDTNKNGEISADALAASSEKLKGLDKNKDGKLTLDEVSPTPLAVNRIQGRGVGEWSVPSPSSFPNVPQPPTYSGAPVPLMIPPQVSPAMPSTTAPQAIPGRRPDGFVPPMSAPRGAGGTGPVYVAPGFPPGAMPMTPLNPETMLNTVMKFDRDGDGKLSREEFLAFARQMTSRTPEARGGDARGGAPRDSNPRDPRGRSNTRGTINREPQRDSAPQRERGRPDASTDRKSEESKPDAAKPDAPKRDEKPEAVDGEKRSQGEDKDASVKIDGVVEIKPDSSESAVIVESIVQNVANPEIATAKLTPNIPPAVEAAPALEDAIAPVIPPVTVEQDKDLQ